MVVQNFLAGLIVHPGDLVLELNKVDFAMARRRRASTNRKYLLNRSARPVGLTVQESRFLDTLAN